ncbi:amidohydrolase family protein [Rhizobium sp. Leaf386]|uniref:amidohydrolase family protein n=1 Tax=Rhizobium sp. Leaf386 TaxID=1736359 RepID=UPI0007129260|nr:amidohydrolase family protein [Rhizobium sp. Leaf386]KQS95569.1 amidohydrolase [Rhizobium sp. Leaf386]
MDTVLQDGCVITGDGTTMFARADVLISGGQILGIDPSCTLHRRSDGSADIIDALGCTITPGIINAHAHGCICGPSMPSGSAPLDDSAVDYNRNRHLLQGTTTLLNVCGLAFPDEIDRGPATVHPMDIHVSTAHTLSNIQAALAVDGAGLSTRHIQATIDQMLSQGAKALGEVGGGQTLGGGAQEYRFIPEAVEREIGLRIDPAVARRLKNAVLGRYLNPGDGVSDEELRVELENCGLAGKVQAEQIRTIVTNSVMPSVSQALAGFEEIARQSARVGYPAIFHNAAPTASRLIELTEKHSAARIVAGHSNHPSFLPDEAVAVAGKLRERGAVVDVSTLDCISTRWRNDPANFDALIESGLVDTISTDYAGGRWDGILEAIHRVVRKKQLSAPAALALATGNVARIFPQLAGDRGLIEKGKRADLVIADSANLGRVRDVFIAGRPIVRNGRIL